MFPFSPECTFIDIRPSSFLTIASYISTTLSGVIAFVKYTFANFHFFYTYKYLIVLKVVQLFLNPCLYNYIIKLMYFFILTTNDFVDIQNC